MIMENLSMQLFFSPIILCRWFYVLRMDINANCKQMLYLKHVLFLFTNVLVKVNGMIGCNTE